MDQVVDWGSTGRWRHTKMASTAGDYSGPEVDETTWAAAAMPFGDTNNPLWLPGVTPFALTDVLWTRLHLPAGVHSVTVRHDDEALVFWNSTLVLEAPSLGETTSTDLLGAGVLAVRARDRAGNIAYLDVRVVTTPRTPVRLYPRDDAQGLGSAPRIFPRPRSDRIVGGHQ